MAELEADRNPGHGRAAPFRGPPALAAVLHAGRGRRTRGQAPQFALETLDGHRVSLADFDGQVVLINFWATWCTPCRLEMPGFQKLYRDKAEQGFVILGIATDRGDRAGVEAFLAERGIEYPVALQTREVNLAFGGVSAIPTSFLIDRNGVIRHRIFGFMPPPALRVAVNRLLDEPAATEVP